MATKNAPGAGRPAKPATTNATAEERAKALLQYAMDRANSFICDAPTTSVVARAARCARVGIPKETTLKALGAIESALADAREAIEAAYAAPAAKPAAESRVTL